MQFKMFSIRDSKAEIFNPPFFSKSHGEAERNFTALVRDNKSQLNQFPEDFDLYFVGHYDDQTGVTQTLDTPVHVVKAINVYDKQN